VWLARPLSEAALAMSAQAATELPDAWASLCEAMPWLAAHGALQLMQQLRVT
jgi:hypothetical protein